MSVDFGGGGGGGGVGAPGGFVDLSGFNFAPPAQSGGPFIDFGNLGSILTAPIRGAYDVGKAALGESKSALLGLPGMAAAAGREAVNNAELTWQDLRHPSVQSLEQLSGTPTLMRGIANAMPALGLNAPWQHNENFPLQPGQQPLPDTPAGLQPFIAGVAKEAPITGPVVLGPLVAGMHAEQLARAGGNTLLPGQPFGSGVGQLGSGAGLLGKTDYAKAAARGGGGVLPMAVNDAASMLPFTEGAATLAEAAGKSAAEEAAARASSVGEAQAAAKEATSAAEKNVDQAAQQYERAVQQRADIAQQASGGHPAAAAAYQAAESGVQQAGQALREAQAAAEQVGTEHGANIDLAQQAADQAQARADTVGKRVAAVKLATKLGDTAAASPFAPLTGIDLGRFGQIPGLSDAVVSGAHAILGSDVGQQHLQPIIDRVQNIAAQARANAEMRDRMSTAAEQKLQGENELRRGFAATGAPLPTEEQTVRRGPLGLFGHKTVEVASGDAQAVADMSKTLEGSHMANLVRQFGPGEAAQRFAEANPNRYTPEQVALAAEVYGPGREVSDQAQQIRDAIPAVRAAYARPGGALEFQNRNYAMLRGEAGVGLVRPEPGPGAFAQVEHNLYGDEANIEHLTQTAKLRAEQERETAAQQRKVDKAGKALIRTQEALGRTGLSAAERENPAQLFGRLYQAPTEAARAIVAQGAHVWDAMATSDEKGLADLGRQVRDGKLSVEAAVPKLTEQIIKLAQRDPDTLDPVALTLVEEARQRGMGDVGREGRAARLNAMTAPAQQIGVGTERARAGGALEQTGAARLARADELYGRAQERMGAETRANTPQVMAAHERVVKAATKLTDLSEKVRAAAERAAGAEHARPLEAAGLSRDDVVKTVLDARRAVAAELDAEAKANIQQLADDGVPKMKWPPDLVERRIMDRSGNQKGRDIVRKVYDPNYAGDIRNLTESGDDLGRNGSRERKIIERGKNSGKVRETRWQPDPRFFGPDGMTPDEIEHTLGQKAAGAGLSKFEGSGTLEGASDRPSSSGIEEWLARVKEIRDTERRAGTLPGMTKAAREAIVRDGWAHDLEVRNRLAGVLDEHWGQQAADELARHIVAGDPREVADLVGERLNEYRNGPALAQEARTARAEKVAAALEADRQTEQLRGGVGGAATRAGRSTLDRLGRAQYDQQVAEDQARIQGKIVGQRETQLGQTAAAGAERARAQGRSEGALLGGSQQLGRTAESDLNAAERAQTQGRAIVGQAPEALQRTAQRLGPMMEMFRQAGRKEQSAADALASYDKEQRALENIGQDYAQRFRELEASVAAAPRAMRPVLEFGNRIHDVLLPLADEADKEYAPAGGGVRFSAGDAYRSAAAEATMMSAEALKKYGLDPQFIIGEREGPQVKGTEQPVNERSPLVTGKTGQREAGEGLKHPIGHEAQYRAAVGRFFQEVDNETGQGIKQDHEAPLAEALRARGFDIEGRSRPEVQQALKDARLVAWDMSDRRGALVPGADLKPDTPVVPLEVWKSWQRYQTHVGPETVGQTFLRGYDATTRFLKRAIRLSPRWNAAVASGHMVMGAIGADYDLARYFTHDMPTAARLLKLTEAGGPMSAEDAAWVRTLHPDVQAALAERNGVPGSVYNRGFVRSEFPSTEATRPRLGTSALGMQSKLDNIGRTAVWIHRLENGLDARGLADFRAQYPDLAHLSDQQIQNEAAIRLSIRTFGDYLNSTPFEKNVLSRTLFFYPWLRHITKLALNTAIHDPLRTLWLLHMGSMFAPGPKPVNFLQSSYDAGNNRWITPPSWDPFESVLGFSDNPVGGLNPLLAGAVGGLTGFDTRTGKPITRPWFEPGGKLAPGEFANYAVNQLPYAQALRESVPALFGSKAVARYGTGQPIILSKGGVREIPSNETQWLGTNSYVPGAVAPWMPYLGLPYQRNINTDEIVARQQAQDRASARAARLYGVRRALLGTG